MWKEYIKSILEKDDRVRTRNRMNKKEIRWEVMSLRRGRKWKIRAERIITE